DYISKPFGVMELISRVNAVLRRTNTVKDSLKTIKFEEIVMDLARRTVYVAGKEVNLTFKEFELLEFLIENEGIVLSRDKIMNRVWDTFFEGESRTVDVHIRTLRLKLGEYGKYIETIRNVGYKIGK
ncbi:MAG: response regulator transcription factor, partial [Tissierellia bacterium]|nr:response regulator transcription factor [Tissierellia bacterium]